MQAKRSWVAMVVWLVGLVVPSAASAEPVPDATCSGPHTTVPGAMNPHFAQTFSALNTGTLTSASLVVDKFAGGNGWTFSINSVAGGVPTNDALTSVAVPESDIPPNDVTLVSVGFPNPLPVESGQQYALAVSRAAGQGGVGARTGDPCPGALFQSSSGGPFLPAGTGSLDMVFTVFVEPTPPQPAAGRTLTLDANKNKVKKGKKVGFSGGLDSAEQACESGQTVDLQRKRPSQTSFTIFAQLQTDAQGNFSLKKKLKKTFEFRAQVPETAGCDDGLSNTEKVKVKKPK